MPTITVPANLDSLETARDYLSKAISPEFRAQTDNVLLTAEELLVNVFSYAYPVGEDGPAKVGLEYRGEGEARKLVFCVTDWGKPFNPFEEAPVPDVTLDLESRPVGGLGIFLIKQVSEEQHYEYRDGANCIRIVFGLTPKTAP